MEFTRRRHFYTNLPSLPPSSDVKISELAAAAASLFQFFEVLIGGSEKKERQKEREFLRAVIDLHEEVKDTFL